MSKYIIEIAEEEPFTIDSTSYPQLYKAVGFKTLVFDEEGLKKLTPYDEESAYTEGFTAAESKYRGMLDNGYQHGLNDAWSAARKMVLAPFDGGYSDDELDACFGEERGNYYALFKKHRPEEAVEKIREYEWKKKKKDTKIQIGDEVKIGDKIAGVAIRINDNDVSLIHTINNCGYVEYVCNKNELTKTGRHVDLSELFGGKEE